MTFLVYHRKDMDGITSGAIAKYYYTINNIPFKEIPFDYYDQFPNEDIPDGSDVIFMDVVIQPYTEMTKLRNRCKVRVIDHHATWIDSPDAKNFPGLMSTAESGCILTWRYFFSKFPIPELIYYLGQFDAWHRDDWEEWRTKDVPANFGAMALNIHPQFKRVGSPDNVNLLEAYIKAYFEKDKETVHKILNTILLYGNVVWNYIYTDYAHTSEQAAVECYLANPDGGNYKAVAINSRMNSFGFDSVYNPDKHDCMIAWYMTKTPGVYTVSLYTEKKDIDLSKIAVQMGGGGHKQACGFKVSKVDFITVRSNDIFYRIQFTPLNKKKEEDESLDKIDSSIDPKEDVDRTLEFFGIGEKKFSEDQVKKIVDSKEVEDKMNEKARNLWKRLIVFKEQLLSSSKRFGVKIENLKFINESGFLSQYVKNMKEYKIKVISGNLGRSSHMVHSCPVASFSEELNSGEGFEETEEWSRWDNEYERLEKSCSSLLTTEGDHDGHNRVDKNVYMKVDDKEIAKFIEELLKKGAR